jgi:predicted aspartyl protease
MKRWVAVAAMVLGLLLLASPLHAGCVLNKIAELPVTMTGLAPMVPAKSNGADVRLVADSGAFYSLLSPSSAVEHGLRLTPAPFNFHLLGIGGEAAISVATVKTFTLADTAIPNVEFLVGGSEPGGGSGLLGQNVLGLADVEYDLANGVIRLMRAHGCADRALAYWAVSKPFSIMEISGDSLASKHTAGAAFVNGVKIRAIFDTGAATSVLSLRAAARAGVKPDDAGVIAAGASGGLGRHTMNTWIAPFASFKIGDEEIRNTKLRIGDLALSGDVEMLIGADFFLSHRVYVANGQKRLYFTYNGGPVFDLTSAARLQAAGDQTPRAAPPLDEGRSEPTTAEGFGARGAAFAARRDFDHAIADFTRACEMAPNEASYFYGRPRPVAEAEAGRCFDQGLQG